MGTSCFYRLGLLLPLLFFWQWTEAQICNMTFQPKVTCVNSGPVGFNATASGSVASVYWDFGDGSKGTGMNTGHIYLKAGVYIPRLVVYFTNGDSCISYQSSITVHDLPIINLKLLNADKQCFIGNSFCFYDSSRSATAGVPIVKRTIFWGDGSIDTGTAKNICHTYADFKNGKTYTITVEMEDSNGCINKREYVNHVTTLPEMKLNFRTTYTLGCMETPVTFRNLSGIPFGDVSRFIWEFGDGSKDSVNWDNFIHVYKKNGSFNAKLTVWSKYGCMESFQLNDAGANIFFEFDVAKDKDSACFRGNVFQFSQTPVPPTLGFRPRFRWNFGDPGSNQFNIDSVSWNPAHSFSSCEPLGVFPNGGKIPDPWFNANGHPDFYYISLWVKIGPCDTVWYRDSVKVHGPQASIETIGINPKNRYQCGTDSPVYFTNLSKYCQAKNVSRMWDFGDSQCPQCTTDTKKGINVGVNCNYSRDSLPVHKYTLPNCYTARLMLWDSVLQCGDTSMVSLALMPPDASNAEFVIDGGKPAGSIACASIDPVNFVMVKLDKTQPSCTRRWVEINVDSARYATSPTNNGKRIVGKNGPNGVWIPQTQFTALHLRNMPWLIALLDPNMPMPTSVAFTVDGQGCDDRYRTIGITIHQYLIQGTDTLERCADTAWYHAVYKPSCVCNFICGDPGKPALHYCTTDTFIYGPSPAMDQEVDPMKTISIDWGVYYDPLTDQYYPEGRTTDSFFYAPAPYGLPDSTVIRYDWNWKGELKTDTFTFSKLNSPYPYRNNRKAGQFQHVYGRNGIFFPSITVFNIAGCDDKGRVMFPVKIKHEFTWNVDDTIACIGQPLNFWHRIQYWDPNFIDLKNPYLFWEDHARIATGKEVGLWDFGDGSPNVTTPHPVHAYSQPGTYRVKFTYKDSINCRDSLVRTIHVVDPLAGIRSFKNPMVCGSIFQFFDSSTVNTPWGQNVLDSLLPENAFGYYWEFGDGKTPSLLKDPYHVYTSNDSFILSLKVRTYNGCEDSVAIPISFIGPRPRFALTDTIGCAPFTAFFENLSERAIPGNSTGNFIWNFGKGDPAQFLITASDSNLYHTYVSPGVYEVYLTQIDTFLNPYTGFRTVCQASFPDTTIYRNQRFRVHVLAVPKAQTLPSDFEVCPYQDVEFVNYSDTVYTRYYWDFGDGSTDSAYAPMQKVRHAYSAPGIYRVLFRPEYDPKPGYPFCPDVDTLYIKVLDVLADFEIADSSQKPVFSFRNTSRNAVKTWWNYGHPPFFGYISDNSPETKHDYKNDTGLYEVCLIAENAEGCRDTTCKMISNYFTASIKVFNVFTPGTLDGKNDVFDIPVEGILEYHIIIYNRWGQRVFESSDSNIDWDGTLFNSGEICPAGAYYFVLDYKLRGQDEPKELNGSITLIR